MLASSSEYLQALRTGKYLRFLEWPHFIKNYYYKDHSTPDADDLLSLLIFDWLSHGYCEEDAKGVALLYAVYSMDSRPIRGNLDYSLTTISGAVFQCMLYQSQGIPNKFTYSGKNNRVEILAFMKKMMRSIDDSTFASLFEKQQNQFFEWSVQVNTKTLNEVCAQISAITAMRYIIEDYMTVLQSQDSSKDSLKITRLGMVQRLNGYLHENTELTPDVSGEIGIYVNKIREMHPAPYEEDYLKAIVPLNFMDNTWRMVTGFGLTFFSFLQKPGSISTDESLKPGV